MRIAFLIALLAVAACNESGQEQRGYEPNERVVTLNIVDHSEVLAVAEDYLGYPLDCTGFAVWAPPYCEIWIVPKEFYKSEKEWERLLGHELRHCFEGDFH